MATWFQTLGLYQKGSQYNITALRDGLSKKKSKKISRFLLPYRGSVDSEIPVLILVFTQVKIDGIMSDIGFTTTGSPLSVEYDIVNQGRNGFVKVSMIHAPTSRASDLFMSARRYISLNFRLMEQTCIKRRSRGICWLAIRSLEFQNKCMDDQCKI